LNYVNILYGVAAYLGSKDSANLKMTETKPVDDLAIKTAGSVNFDRKKMAMLSDLTIKTLDGEKIPCHKLMLANDSEVFAKMFKHDETETNEILIEEFSKVTVGDYVDFVYDGKLEKQDSLTIELLLMADKYELAALKDACAKYLATHVTKQNVAELWEVSDALKTPELIKAVRDFLQKATHWMSEIPGMENVIKKNPGYILDLFKMCKVTGAEQEAKLVAQETKLVAQETKLVAQETKLVAQETKLVAQETKLVAQETKLVAQEEKLAVQKAELERLTAQIWLE